jgi:hypothetical protein
MRRAEPRRHLTRAAAARTCGRGLSARRVQRSRPAPPRPWHGGPRRARPCRRAVAVTRPIPAEGEPGRRRRRRGAAGRSPGPVANSRRHGS